MRRQMTRRYFLASGSAALATAWMSGACRGQPTPTATPASEPQGAAQSTPSVAGTPTVTQPTPTLTEAPRRGGILALRIDADPSIIDLHQATSIVDLWSFVPCFDLLVQYDPLDPTKLIPDLAERWEVSDDGLLYTFHLKPGVKFHDGTPLTSRDVRVSFERIISPPSGVRSPRAPLFDSVEAIETPDDSTVQFRLREPDTSLLANIAIPFNIIYPAKLIESGADLKDPHNIIGTGAFRFKQYTPGVSVELERNPEYHVSNLPYLDGIALYVIPDENALVNAFIAGQIHIYRADPAPFDMFRSTFGDDIVISAVPSTATSGLDLNADRLPAWKDLRVRQAASLAIDRAAAIQVAGQGYGAISGYMLPGGPWALPEERLRSAPGFGGDPEENLRKAKELMSAAGYADGFDCQMLAARGREDLQVFIADQWAKIGIRVTLDVQELGTFLQKRYTERAFDACQSIHGPAIDDPKAVFAPFLDCGAPLNVSGICDPELVELYTKQQATSDQSSRKDLINELDFRCISEMGGGRILVYRSYIFGVYRPSVVGGWQLPYSQYLTEKHTTTWLKIG